MRVGFSFSACVGAIIFDTNEKAFGDFMERKTVAVAQEILERIETVEAQIKRLEGANVGEIRLCPNTLQSVAPLAYVSGVDKDSLVTTYTMILEARLKQLNKEFDAL